MSQTRLGSALETAANIVIGFSINWCANMLVLPMFGFHIKPVAAFNMGLVFTVISLIRGYWLRRLFNRIRALHEHP
jgi:hypothetical protein